MPLFEWPWPLSIALLGAERPLSMNCPTAASRPSEKINRTATAAAAANIVGKALERIDPSLWGS
jgi:hypothetical protein